MADATNAIIAMTKLATGLNKAAPVATAAPAATSATVSSKTATVPMKISTSSEIDGSIAANKIPDKPLKRAISAKTTADDAANIVTKYNPNIATSADANKNMNAPFPPPLILNAPLVKGDGGIII